MGLWALLLAWERLLSCSRKQQKRRMPMMEGSVEKREWI
jgi:hypothetical protein